MFTAGITFNAFENIPRFIGFRNVLNVVGVIVILHSTAAPVEPANDLPQIVAGTNWTIQVEQAHTGVELFGEMANRAKRVHWQPTGVWRFHIDAVPNEEGIFPVIAQRISVSKKTSARDAVRHSFRFLVQTVPLQIVRVQEMKIDPNTMREEVLRDCPVTRGFRLELPLRITTPPLVQLLRPQPLHNVSNSESWVEGFEGRYRKTLLVSRKDTNMQSVKVIVETGFTHDKTTPKRTYVQIWEPNKLWWSFFEKPRLRATMLSYEVPVNAENAIPRE